ncbi:myb-related protein 2-like [Diospyros lotus]|uniref:myb-related protein 2-like n=1 Tax=Diospyros lotus TaxID=55363 RepID=UPI002258C785|nr:myb-related protein 2-like [Diospyros lotus]
MQGGIPGLTLYHLKRHLQKYRLGKNLHGHVNGGTNKNGEKMSETNNGTHTVSPSFGPQANKSLHISEAMQMQIEVQRRLHEQLEVQRHLQLRIEAQGKYLQAVLEKAQETLGRQNPGAVGLEVAKVQLSELVSKVSTQCLNSKFSGVKSKELSSLCPQPNLTSQPTDCSMDSCLTSCEGLQSPREQDMHNSGMGLIAFNACATFEKKEADKEPRLRQTEHRWCTEDLIKENKKLVSSVNINTERSMLSIEMDSVRQTIMT